MEHWKSLLVGLLDLRERLAADALYDYGVGICGNLSHGGLAGDEPDDVLEEAFRAWPKFSGNADYPVPSPEHGLSNEGAYLFLNLWDGEYGKLRLELLDFCIEYAERRVKT